jgi:hypothetical protein
LPAHVKVKYSSGHTADAAARKKKGKCKEGDSISEPDLERKTSNEKRLATLDIFAGCGGLSEGLHQSGNPNCIYFRKKHYCLCYGGVCIYNLIIASIKKKLNQSLMAQMLIYYYFYNKR